MNVIIDAYAYQLQFMIEPTVRLAKIYRRAMTEIGAEITQCLDGFENDDFDNFEFDDKSVRSNGDICAAGKEDGAEFGLLAYSELYRRVVWLDTRRTIREAIESGIRFKPTLRLFLRVRAFPIDSFVGSTIENRDKNGGKNRQNIITNWLMFEQIADRWRQAAGYRAESTLEMALLAMRLRVSYGTYRKARFENRNLIKLASRYIYRPTSDRSSSSSPSSAGLSWSPQRRRDERNIETIIENVVLRIWSLLDSVPDDNDIICNYLNTISGAGYSYEAIRFPVRLFHDRWRNFDLKVDFCGLTLIERNEKWQKIEKEVEEEEEKSERTSTPYRSMPWSTIRSVSRQFRWILVRFKTSSKFNPDAQYTCDSSFAAKQIFAVIKKYCQKHLHDKKRLGHQASSLTNLAENRVPLFVGNVEIFFENLLKDFEIAKSKKIANFSIERKRNLAENDQDSPSLTQYERLAAIIERLASWWKETNSQLLIAKSDCQKSVRVNEGMQKLFTLATSIFEQIGSIEIDRQDDEDTDDKHENDELNHFAANTNTNDNDDKKRKKRNLELEICKNFLTLPIDEMMRQKGKKTNEEEEEAEVQVQEEVVLKDDEGDDEMANRKVIEIGLSADDKDDDKDGSHDDDDDQGYVSFGACGGLPLNLLLDQKENEKIDQLEKLELDRLQQQQQQLDLIKI